MTHLSNLIAQVVSDAREASLRLQAQARKASANAAGMLVREQSAQGTTEYAILVGVLVVIAILAIIAFRAKVSELWDAIAQGINSL